MNKPESVPQALGRYQLRSRLGAGGQATVFRAFDPRFQRDVAVKTLSPQLLHHPQFQERFYKEAQLIAALEHHAIVPVYDFGVEQGVPYIVMRHMLGGSLADKLQQQGPLSISTVTPILDRVCAGLDKIHRAGFVHRDIKPANILFDQEGAAYIADFGIARLAEQDSGGTITGTPQYMSPEQIAGQSVSPQTDIYQLGVMLYFLLTGKYPYTGKTNAELFYHHIHTPFPLIATTLPEYPYAVDKILQAATRKSPTERISSASIVMREWQKLSNKSEQKITSLTELQLENTQSPIYGPKLKWNHHQYTWFSLGILAIIVLLGLWNYFSRNSDVENAPKIISAVSTSEVQPVITVMSTEIQTTPIQAPVPLPTGTSLTNVSPTEIVVSTNTPTASPIPVASATIQAERPQLIPAASLSTSILSEQITTSNYDNLQWYETESELVLVNSDMHEIVFVNWQNSITHTLPLPTSLDTVSVWIQGATSEELILFSSRQTDTYFAIYNITSQQVTGKGVLPLAVNAAVASPDGRFLAVGDIGGNLIVWDVVLGVVTESLSATGDGISSLAWSPNGKILALGSIERAITLLDVYSMEPFQTLSGHSWAISNLDWSISSEFLASTSIDGLRVWHNHEGNSEFLQQYWWPSEVGTLDWRYDDVLAVGDNVGEIQLWSATDNEIIQNLAEQTAIKFLTWSDGGTYLAGMTQDRQIIIWETEHSADPS